MEWIELETLEDARLEPFRRLHGSVDRGRSDYLIAEGRLVVQRLLDSEHAVQAILIDGPPEQRLAGLPLPAGTPIYRLAKPLMQRLVGYKFHRGVLAAALRPTIGSLADFTPQRWPRLIVGIANVNDPENVGTLIRTSAAFGVRDFVVDALSADPYSRRVLRVSMGTVLQVGVCQCDRFEETLPAWPQRRQVSVLATVLDPQATPLMQLTRPARTTLVLFGNEGHGLSVAQLAQVDQRVTIPIDNAVDSLNVGVAAGIVLHRLQQL